MFSILLVDDEENILRILQDLIPWQELGVEQLLTAQDGQCALDVMKQHKIDILITDIKMPRLDGIALLERVKNQHPEIKCILLTAYGEFEYAKKAISLGVENYLLKPVIKEELEQTVEKTLDNLYRNRSSTVEQLRENILRRWVGGNISSEELSDRAEILNLNLYMPQYCVICFAKKTVQNIRNLVSIYENCLTTFGEVYSFWDESGRYIMIIAGKEIDSEKLLQKLTDLTVNVRAENKVRISLGEVVCDIALLHFSYQIACDNLEAMGTGESYIVQNNHEFGINPNTDYLMEEIRFLMFCDDEETRCNGYKRLGLKLYREDQKKDMSKLLIRLSGICMIILNTEFPERIDCQNQIIDVQKVNDIDISQKFFLEETERVLLHTQQVFEQEFSQFSPIVQKACRYVQNSVLSGESCSIKEFCAQNAINAAYLGHIYKLETGIFFNEYLMQRRINRSIILLRNPTNRIKTIAEMVGFSSVSYFVKRFRECKGMSPDKYRVEMLKNV